MLSDIGKCFTAIKQDFHLVVYCSIGNQQYVYKIYIEFSLKIS